MVADFLAVFIPIFVIVDPLGNIPVFLAMTADDPPEVRNRVIFKACLIAWFILVAFTLAGRGILMLFQISIPAFQIAAGLVLFSIAMDMLRARRVLARTSREEEKEGVDKDDISVFPLAIPMLSGPGAMSAVTVLAAGGDPIRIRLWLLAAIAITMITTYIILRYSIFLMSRLGHTGIFIIQRLMGLILAVISVQFAINGINQLIPGGLNISSTPG